jgi:hypothetical protein
MGLEDDNMTVSALIEILQKECLDNGCRDYKVTTWYYSDKFEIDTKDIDINHQEQEVCL